MNKFKSISKLLVERPLVFILLSVILGNIAYLIYNINILGVVMVTTLLIFLGFIVIDKRFFIILITFFIFSFMSCVFYYGIRENKRSIYNIRVEKVQGNKIYAILRGRKVRVRGELGTAGKGEIIKFRGKFKSNINIEDGIVGEVFIKEILTYKKDYIYYVNRLSEKYYDKLSNYIGENSSGLLTALLFGSKDYMSYEQISSLVDLGVIHLICISGLHLTLLFQFINKVFNLKISLIICGIYVLIIGYPASAVRALIMMATLGISKSVFKTYDWQSALSLSAIFLIFSKPYNLYDVGFALSFLATLGILLFYSNLNKAFYNFPSSINKFLSVTLSAQALIYPYMVLRFNSFTINFLFAGAIITPIISLMIPLGFLSMIFIWSNKILGILVIPLKILITTLNGVLIVIENFIFPNIYISVVYAIAYMIMLLAFYMSYKGFKEFRKIFYIVIPILFIYSFSFTTKIKFLQEGWNKAIIIEKGYTKTAITNKNNDYLYNLLRKKHGVTSIHSLDEDLTLKIEKKYVLSIDSNLNNAYLIGKECDIINLNNYKNSFIKVSNTGIKKTTY